MGKKITTFGYHDVTDDVTTSGFQNPWGHKYKHPTNHFCSDLDLILDSKPPQRAIGVPAMDGSLPESNDSMLFTLDDGGKSSMYIADILESRGIFAYFFMTTRMLGDQAFLSKENIRDLVSRGHVVGSHTHNHFNPFRLLSYDEKVTEWGTSCAILEDILSKPIACGAIPGGSMDRDTFRAAEKVGMNLLFTSIPTRNIRKYGGVTAVGRVCPNTTTSPALIRYMSRANTLFAFSFVWQSKSAYRHCRNKLKKRKVAKTK